MNLNDNNIVKFDGATSSETIFPIKGKTTKFALARSNSANEIIPPDTIFIILNHDANYALIQHNNLVYNIPMDCITKMHAEYINDDEIEQATLLLSNYNYQERNTQNILTASANKNKLLADAHKALAVLYVLLPIPILLYMMVTEAKSISDFVVGIVVIYAFFGIFSSFHFLVSKGVGKGKKWARTASSVAAVIMLLGFPVGTFIGIHLLKYAKSWEPAS
ncbi:hypothetical protein SAMN02745119_02279 [Trichlorobacter thiogenes]|uniref:Uncharacterized protein n=1 Tax=Trichlorobacter thiogenes TaxID=115783 RepID=A0A1T4Q7G1_9BACT|nr:hypothetical protein [Trichlorobacter thiogenes]SJZ99713.1 hypothetical protein SAMN02745119_02279 [Trichlorobacter thiogenes]